MSEEKKNVPEQETEKEPEVQETPQEETCIRLRLKVR